MIDGRRTTAGVAFGIGAGALWGLVFLAPELAGDFSPLQLTVGRYLAYGVIAAFLIAPRWRGLSVQLLRRDWIALGWLSLAGNTAYYVLLASAVQLGGIAMTSLVIGFLPVAVTLLGSRDVGAAPLGRLWPSLVLCAAGAVCIGWQALVGPQTGALSAGAAGLACAIGALVSWTGYAVGNSRALARLPAVSSHDWSLLIGLVTGVQALAMAPAAALFGAAPLDGPGLVKLTGVSVSVAILASIVGNGLWNRMSRLLPLTLVGQMILFETLFALLYGFLWEQRWPTGLEVAAFVLVVLSVTSCVAAHRRPGAEAQAAAIV
ncbi:DMT family transporter [Phenylobacterium deserti]|uniref:EamA/RhaT family transporter n=1 Tax=Phenylobacterium deserti TaxID=1914756 RepID=A0A328ASB0_9CAUL|nr:DMT family transporter [Phenylobacterium deserti]RAK57952.1 EamA/RhaT family transporter [Phenylobacterium deserti]